MKGSNNKAVPSPGGLKKSKPAPRSKAPRPSARKESAEEAGKIVGQFVSAKTKQVVLIRVKAGETREHAIRRVVLAHATPISRVTRR